MKKDLFFILLIGFIYAVEEKLNVLLDVDGGISKQKVSVYASCTYVVGIYLIL